MFGKLIEALRGNPEPTGTSITIGSARRRDLQIPIEEVLTQSAEALSQVTATKALELMRPIGENGLTAFDAFCQRFGIDEQSQVVGAHLLLARATGVQSTLLQQLEDQGQEARKRAQEKARPLRQKAVQLAERGVGMAIKLASSPLTASIREIRSFASWETENKW